MKQLTIAAFFCLTCLTAESHAVQPNLYQALEAASKLEREQRLDDAFRAYLSIPGAEYKSARIGRSDPTQFLKVLRQHAGKGSSPAIKAVEGDLLLASGDRARALASYRGAFDGLTAAEFDETYLAEPADSENVIYPFYHLVTPFAQGPGSHRDNWLIRRFIALEAWDDAAGEFARVWKIHCRNAKPYLVDVQAYDSDGKATTQRQRVKPRGFNSRGLQFALDYAFFLKKTDKLPDALRLLAKPLLVIDMDRDPNAPIFTEAPKGNADSLPLRRVTSPVRGYGFGHFPLGISRKEFIRLTYGMYKESKTEDQLVQMLQGRIDQGQNPLRRVMARIRMHQNRPEDALSLELVYIERAQFDPLSATYRRGLAYEDSGQQQQAIDAYQEALAMPFQRIQPPDPEERVSPGNTMQQAVAAPMVAPGHGFSSETAFHAGLLTRLERLYSGMGQGEKAFDMALRRMESAQNELSDLQRLANTATRAQTLGRQAQFQKWLRDRLKERTSDTGQQAAILWTLGEYEACADALAKSWAEGKDDVRRYVLEPWVQRYRGLGDDHLRRFLDAVLDADPANSHARLERLSLQVPRQTEETIAHLEALLQPDAEPIFVRGKGVYNRTQFRNYFDLAYRLMRLYERTGRIDSLQSLGLRVAAGGKHFEDWIEPSSSGYQYRDENDWPEDVNACLSLLVQYADEATLQELERLWQAQGDFPARRQLARRRTGRLVTDKSPSDFGWSNLPRGARALVGTRTVLSLSCDDRHIYSGHPWGIAVYDIEGRPVTRIALGEAALALAAADGVVWAGTPKGLFRIDRDKWAVHHLWLNADIATGSSRPTNPGELAAYWYDNCVHALTLDKDQLWIGTQRNMQRLDTRANRLRSYSPRELRIDRSSSFSRILPDGRYVWAQCDAGLRRWDRASDTWQSVDHGQRGVGLIGLIDGRLFGHTWLNDQLRDRPCLIDRDTLTVKPLLIEGSLTDSERMMNGPFSFHGWYEGRLVFSPGHRLFVFDESIGALRPIGGEPSEVEIDTPLPPGFRYGKLWWSRPVEAGDAQPLYVHQLEGNRWTLLQLPTGRLIAGKRSSYAPRYQYPGEDWPFTEHTRNRKRRNGGLHFVDVDGTSQEIGDGDFGDGLRGDTVFAAVDDPASDTTWLCTDLGLAAVDRDGHVRDCFTRADGLCANRITSGVVVGDRLYFSSGWGDHGGGLLLADPATAVFTSFVQSDGLATSKIARIEPVENGLRVVYDVEYGRYQEYGYRLYPPGLFDAATGEVTSGGQPQYPDQSTAFGIDAQRTGKPGRTMPYLGGFVTGQYMVAGKTYLSGTRGAVILYEAGVSPLHFERLAVQLDVDPHNAWQREAEGLSIAISDPPSFEAYVTHENPYVRHKALLSAQWRIQEAPQGFRDALTKLTRDSYTPVRRLAVELLGRTADQTVVATVQRLLADSDTGVRDAAVLALVRLGKPPGVEHLERMLAARREASDRFEIIQAFASTATARTFEILLRYPVTTDDYEPRQAVFSTLGQALLREPSSVEVLLKAYTHPQDPGPDSNFGAARFAQEVFQHAGAKILPRLHTALASRDRVIRSNAARGCGAIGDPNSIAPLIAALDLESGLSRASIVWALGELRAKEALPQLASLFTDAKNDEQRNRGSGFRVAQAAAQIVAQYESIGRLGKIESDWDELQRAATPGPVDPRRNEPLLSTSIVLTAVRKIGPEFSQAFYRQLAGEKDPNARQEAAVRLAEVGSRNSAENIPILRNLLADHATHVQMTAAASLLILDRRDGQPQILAWLKSPESWQRSQLLQQLERVPDGKRLTFAREAIADAARDMSTNAAIRQRSQQLLSRIPDR